MNKTADEHARPATFGRRKIVPHACIADSKPHIRTFLTDSLEDLGFATSECAEADSLNDILSVHCFDLAVLGLSADGIEANQILQVLAERNFDGKVLPIGPSNSVLAAAVRQLGEELGIDILPTLPTPFSAEALRDSVAGMLPTQTAPRPAVDVAEALKAGWLELWYQQKIDTRTLAPRGVEALVRMRHPAWGVVLPSHFIPDGHDPNFRALSEFVIESALDDWRYFLANHGPVDISINLPISFLKDQQAIRQLCEQMPAHPAFNGLTIEVRCAEIIEDLNRVAEIAKQIRFHNIAIAIDDVGVEWPELLALDAFPFTELKVDRQFVTGCADDRLKQTVCRSIIELAQDHGARAVAKGVESRADFLAANEIGFDQVQGFLFGKPMGVRKFARAALGRPIVVSL